MVGAMFVQGDSHGAGDLDAVSFEPAANNVPEGRQSGVEQVVASRWREGLVGHRGAARRCRVCPSQRTWVVTAAEPSTRRTS